MTYKFAIFDFDGTLADSFDVFLACLNEAAARHGFRPVGADTLDEARGMSGQELIAHLGVPFWKLPAIALEMRLRMMARIDLVRPFEGAQEALGALAGRGVGLALLTSNSREAVRTVLGDEAIGHFGQLHCDTSMFGKRAKLRELLSESGHPAAEVVCIGDEIRDGEAAREVGMDFLGVAWGYTRPDVLQAHCTLPLLHAFGALPDRLSSPPPPPGR